MKKFKRAFSFSDASRERHFDITETIDEHSEHFTTEDGNQNGHKNGGKYKPFPLLNRLAFRLVNQC
jgi:hypothetical protein